ncbi:hypothetical protein TPMD03_9 [Thiohalocapsa phage LS06-2018-MD03]|nr:hypothetical protein TPMD03_9 [Thiohalocapsa phage LS06-2018-MD03]
MSKLKKLSVKELIQAKSRLELKILNGIKDFQELTDVDVKSISYSVKSHTRVNYDPAFKNLETIITDVHVELDL